MSEIALPHPRYAPALLGAGRESASFRDLSDAHLRSEKDPAAREDYLEIRRRFQQEQGEIMDEYWASSVPAGVAVTWRPGRFRIGRRLALHRRTEQLSAGRPDFARLLLRVDRQSVRASNVLAGMSQRIAMSNLYSLTREITTYLESGHTTPSDRESYKEELDGIDQYVSNAGARQAQIIYLQGMMRGLFALFVLAPLLAWMFSQLDVPGVEPTLFVACLVAGSFGAAMSVLIRMSGGKFVVNHEVGREYVTNLGFARPFIGAIFALLLYFAFRGELLQQIQLPTGPKGELAFFVATGFLIGFSERFAKEIVKAAQPLPPSAAGP
jgi:hypothetical protein